MHGFKWNFLMTQLLFVVKLSFLCTGEPAKILNQKFNAEITPDESFKLYCSDDSDEKWKSGSILRKRLCKTRGNARSYADMRTGYQVALKFCEQRMKNERWNCSLDFGNKERTRVYSDGVLPSGLQGTKQAAFYYSLTRAAMSYTITESCLNDHTLPCACERIEPKASEITPDFPQPNLLSNHTVSPHVLVRFSQCSNADVDYGIDEAVRTLNEVSARLKKKGRLSRFDRLNLINADVGRKVYRNMSRVVCRCHGHSGTCTTVSCWRRHPSIRDISFRLKKMYHEARYLSGKRLNTLWKTFVKRGNSPKKPRLFYHRRTPSLCERSHALGIKGIAGRVVPSTETAAFCCTNGMTKTKQVFIENCRCRFEWCCEVQCDKCKTERIKHVCGQDPIR